jgi:hypothetical protein
MASIYEKEAVARRGDPQDVAKRESIGQALLGKNAGVEGSIFHTPEYFVSPRTLNAGGFYNPQTGNVVITEASDNPARTLAHEQMHKRWRDAKTGGQALPPARTGYPRGAVGDPSHMQLLKNMRGIEHHKQDAPMKNFSRNYHQDVEEQTAALMGYEGTLPAGTPITQSELAPALFNGNQELIDYYYTNSSFPHGGVWEGQTDSFVPSNGGIAQTIINVLRKAGIGRW